MDSAKELEASAVVALSQERCKECFGSGDLARCDVPFPCPPCGGTGARVPGLRRRHLCAWDKENYEQCSKSCQGRGWALIPSGEVLGVLVRVLRDNPRVWLTAEVIIKALFDEHPEEALAAAISQAGR